MKVGQGYEYELLYDGEGEDGGRFVMGLAAPGQPYDAERSVPEGARSPHGRGLVGARSENGRAGESAAKPPPASLCGASADDVSATSLSRLNGGHAGSGGSYRHPTAASACSAMPRKGPAPPRPPVGGTPD